MKSTSSVLQTVSVCTLISGTSGLRRRYGRALIRRQWCNGANRPDTRRVQRSRKASIEGATAPGCTHRKPLAGVVPRQRHGQLQASALPRGEGSANYPMFLHLFMTRGTESVWPERPALLSALEARLPKSKSARRKATVAFERWWAQYLAER